MDPRPSEGFEGFEIPAREHVAAAHLGGADRPEPCGIQVGDLLNGGRMFRCIEPKGHTGPHVPLE